jgi:CRP/FNR family cyclic AMP-dependent transcriptional regulator
MPPTHSIIADDSRQWRLQERKQWGHMKTIHNLHNFIDELSPAIRSELHALAVVRDVHLGEPVYRLGDQALEMYQLLAGSVQTCNYSLDGKEVITGQFKPGDCFGEMGLIDGLPRVSFTLATSDSRVRVIAKADFDEFYQRYPEFSHQINIMLCRRIRMLYSLAEDAQLLSLHQRLARTLHRLSYSHGNRDDRGELCIDTSHEELGRLLGASRQSISKELKSLEREGCIAIRYGKIHIVDLDALGLKYELLLGVETVTAVYRDQQPD